jgi:3-deoxy-manno-octulosonate cytidylyltransferase (CMP-KDO synthetase)
MKILGVIPARYQSSRMPGKPLADIYGKPMIWWVYQQAKKAENIFDVIVATDDERIKDVCNSFSMKVMMTSTKHNTPTSRLYEVSTKINADLYLLIMGDEPLIDSRSFDLIIPKEINANYYISVLANEIDKPSEVIDFSNQKAVVNQWNEILLISRSPIPYPKGSLDFSYRKVTGIQMFNKNALNFYNDTPMSELEKAEENDLMRFIENRIPVIMINSPHKTISVDTYKDLEKVREIIKNNITNFRLDFA